MDEWMKNKPELYDTMVKEYQVFIVLSDGGASRAGYWVSSVLAKLQDESKGEFGKHLLCLSGASGGSFGNAIFYSQLSKYANEKNLPENFSYLNGAQQFCKKDNLTFALAHMLGPDYFRHVFPISAIYDRSAALEFSMENPGDSVSGFPDLSVSLSHFIYNGNKENSNLPMLFVNSTCMQNGNPAIVSTVEIGDAEYNGRIDVLSQVDSMTKKSSSCKYDMKLSNAVVLGARFPYVSPAGKIGDYYFVDGGYFDNSGSGAVMEMLTLMKKKFKNDERFRKLRFNILHITNSPPDKAVNPKVHPLVNDLAAPAKTLLGAYGQQTEINDKRLKSFMMREFNDSTWFDISLYCPCQKFEEDYSMNWYISDYNLNRMNTRLSVLTEFDAIRAKLTKLRSK